MNSIKLMFPQSDRRSVWSLTTTLWQKWKHHNHNKKNVESDPEEGWKWWHIHRMSKHLWKQHIGHLWLTFPDVCISIKIPKPALTYSALPCQVATPSSFYFTLFILIMSTHFTASTYEVYYNTKVNELVCIMFWLLASLWLIQALMKNAYDAFIHHHNSSRLTGLYITAH